MNKKEIIKLVIYIICVPLSLVFYYTFLPLTKPMSRGWGAEDIIPLPKHILIIICIIWSLIFTFLAIKKIIMIKSNKQE